MRISMIGCKGIPASAASGGGIETHVEELATRLAAKGHNVTVYVREYANPTRRRRLRGVRLITLPSIRRKNLDAISHTFLASIHVIFQRTDIIHYHGVGPATLAWIPRIFKPFSKVVVTFHSRDRFHEKWGAFAKAYLALGEWASVRFPHATIGVSHGIKLFCQNKYHAFVWHIPNGVGTPDLRIGTKALEAFGLESGKYFFTLSRLVPHKAVEDAILAFKGLDTDMKLVVIGEPSSKGTEVRYAERLEKIAFDDPRVIFTGRQTGDALNALIAHSYAMVHPSRSEGLSVSVLEAMSYGKMVVMSDIPENRELIDHSGIAYPVGDVQALREVLQCALSDPQMVKARGDRGRAIVERLYSWDSVVERTEAVYSSL